MTPTPKRIYSQGSKESSAKMLNELNSKEVQMVGEKNK